jgi:SP family sugar:H+ symporter-like MFS transporter
MGISQPKNEAEPKIGSREKLSSPMTQKFPKQNAPSCPSTTGSMLRLSLWVSFAAWISNFDNGYSGTVLIMPSYNKTFGSCEQVLDPETYAHIEHCTLTPLQQSLISLNYLFIAVGGGVAGLTGQKFGRRGAIQVGCALAIIGAAGMLGTGGSFLHYMVCRSISAVGIGHLIAASVTYGSECIVASKRGLSLGLYNVGLAMGNLASSAVCAGSARLEPNNNWQWKTPILCQIPLGIILGAGILMLPESPRWFMGHGREDEARQSFSVLYCQSPYSPDITAQIDDIKTHLANERAGAKEVSWYDIYRKKYIRRTFTSVLIMVGLAITGIQFVQPYATLFLKGVGISNPYLINVIIGLCILGGSILGPFIVEYGGRRVAILSGYIVMAICMLILSSVGTSLGTDDTAQIVIVVLLCMWAFVFGGTIAPSAGLASVEMHSVSLRTFGHANTTVFHGIFSFGATFWTPYMLSPNYGNMGPNVGYFYAGVTVVVAVLVFLLVPETAQLTLEQIDEVFNSGIMAWKTSAAKNKVIALSKQRDFVNGDSEA